MQKCKSCERELQKDEIELCPACDSGKSHKIKNFIEVAIPIVLAIGGLAFKLLRKK
jgi:Zn finger protein HypA/HybF involved in hydrogenase expression